MWPTPLWAQPVCSTTFFWPFLLNGVVAWWSQRKLSFGSVLGLASPMQVRCSWPASTYIQATDFTCVYPGGSLLNFNPLSQLAGLIVTSLLGAAGLLFISVSFCAVLKMTDGWDLLVVLQYNLHFTSSTFAWSGLKEQGPGHLMEGQNTARWCISFPSRQSHLGMSRHISSIINLLDSKQPICCHICDYSPSPNDSPGCWN